MLLKWRRHADNILHDLNSQQCLLGRVCRPWVDMFNVSGLGHVDCTGPYCGSHKSLQRILKWRWTQPQFRNCTLDWNRWTLYSPICTSQLSYILKGQAWAYFLKCSTSQLHHFFKKKKSAGKNTNSHVYNTAGQQSVWDNCLGTYTHMQLIVVICISHYSRMNLNLHVAMIKVTV